MNETELYRTAALEKRCPECGGPTHLVDATSFTGNEIREYACTRCDGSRIFNCGPALRQLLSEAREKEKGREKER